MEKLSFKQIGRIFLLLGLIFGAYFLLKEGFFYLYPLLLAWGLAALAYPISAYLSRSFRLPLLPAAILTVCAILSLFLLLIYGLSLVLLRGISELIPFATEQFERMLQSSQALFDLHIWQSYQRYLTDKQQALIEGQVQDMIGQVGQISLAFLQELVFKMIRLLSVFPYSLMILLFVLLASILMTKDWLELKAGLRRLLPKALLEAGGEVGKHFKALFLAYIQAQLTIAGLTALFLWLGLTLLKVKHALMIVVITAIIDLLPLVGTGLIFLPWIIYLFFTGHYALTIQLSILYALVVIMRQILEPKIVSSRIGIRPLTVLITLFLSLQFFGAIGLIFAPLLIILAHALYQAGIYRRLWAYISS